MPDAGRTPGFHPPSPDSSPEWTVADLLRVFYRRRLWILGMTAACLSATFLYCALATARYRATAEIEVDKQSSGAFGLDNAASDKPTTEIADSFDQNLTLQTQMGILQSDAIALDVIRRTGLENTPDFFARRPDPLLWLHKRSFWRKPLEPLSTPLAEAPDRRYVALKLFAQHRKVTAVAGTRLIALSYTDPDPARAAQVVRALILSLADYGNESRSAAAAQSASWLESQLAGLRLQTETLDDRAAALDRQAGALGDDDSHNVVLARLDALNASLSTAESSRIVREAIWRAAQTGDPEALSGLGGNPAAGINTQNSFALLQSLRAQESSAKSQLAESANRYGDNWPAVAEQRARLATIQKSIQEEIARLGQRAHSDYAVSLQAENEARAAFTQQKDLASRMTGSAVALRLARQEAGESRGLYTTLLARLQQTGVLEGLHSASFHVVTPPLPPPPDHPSSPSLPLLSAVALLAGGTLGSAAAILRELTDESIHSVAELEALLQAPVLALLPAVALPARRRSAPLRTAPSHAPSNLLMMSASGVALTLSPLEDPALEAIQSVRTWLTLKNGGSCPQVILFAPADAPDRRKHKARRPSAAPVATHPACLLACTLAEQGASVLYVDADLRTARVPEEPCTNPLGLSDLLSTSGPATFSSASSVYPLLSILPAGSPAAFPGRLIASTRMADLLAQWRDEFRFVILRSPAAAHTETQVLAQFADAAVLLVDSNRTTQPAARQAFNTLRRFAAPDAVLGVVLQGVAAEKRIADA